MQHIQQRYITGCCLEDPREENTKSKATQGKVDLFTRKFPEEAEWEKSTQQWFIANIFEIQKCLCTLPDTTAANRDICIIHKNLPPLFMLLLLTGIKQVSMALAYCMSFRQITHGFTLHDCFQLTYRFYSTLPMLIHLNEQEEENKLHMDTA